MSKKVTIEFKSDAELSAALAALRVGGEWVAKNVGRYYTAGEKLAIGETIRQIEEQRFPGQEIFS